MPEERDRAPLHQMNAALEDVASLIAGMDEAAFLTDRRTQLAVGMALVIVGESANTLSESARHEAPEVDWRSVVGLRNRIAHGYGSLDQKLVWSIAVQHAPLLADSVARLRGSMGH